MAMFSVQTPSPAPPAGNDPSRDIQLPAVQSKSTPWIQLNAVYTLWTTEMPQRAKQPLLTFSPVFLGELFSALSFPTLAPAQGQGWLPELWPKGKAFQKAGSSGAGVRL